MILCGINMCMNQKTLEEYSVPISIVIAGVIIAGAIMFSGGGILGSPTAFGNNLSQIANNVNPVNEMDHIKGNPSAEVSIIEFSDYECPFCQRVHSTLNQIVEDFDGEVKWIYRHFPLTSIHSNAFSAGVAGECVAQLGGNESFWNFTEQLFASQDSLSEALYEDIASSNGIQADALKKCMGESRIREIVQDQTQNAIDSGGRGTPYVIVVNKKGETFPFSGALPYEQIRTIIQSAIRN